MSLGLTPVNTGAPSLRGRTWALAGEGEQLVVARHCEPRQARARGSLDLGKEGLGMLLHQAYSVVCSGQ